MRKMTDLGKAVDFKFVRLSAMCGIAAPICYVAASIIGGILKPGYSPLAEYVSAIGVGGDVASYVMNFGGFFLCGLFLLFFAPGLWKRIGFDETTKMIVPVIIGISGSGFLIMSFFPWDNSMHGPTTFFASFVGIAPFFSTFIFRKDERWKSYWLFSLILVVSTILIAILLKFAIPTLPGLYQRMTFTPAFLWVEVIAFRLFKLA